MCAGSDLPNMQSELSHPASAGLGVPPPVAPQMLPARLRTHASQYAAASSLAAQPQAGSLESMIAQRRAESGRASFEEILDAD